MENIEEKSPSKFSVPPFSTDDEIWRRILQVLTPSEKLKANRAKSQFNDPFLGGKEIFVKSIKNEDIAVAMLSEVRADGDEWAIYREI